MEELRATREIARLTSWQDAANTFRAKIDIQIMNRNGFKEPPAVHNRLIRKHETVMRYFEERDGEWFASYDYEGARQASTSESFSGRIWLCWWQGLDQAPELVKRCVRSIEEHAGGHEVILITDENVREYITFPKWLLEKHQKGIISKTNLSDLLRLSLLAKYGGLWLDSTFLCTGELEDLAFGSPLFSIKRPDYGHCSVACGYFAGYALACDSDTRWIFSVIRDFFLRYWKTNDFLVDYLVVDYMIVLAQRHCSEIEEAFAAIRPNNPRCDDLFVRLGDIYHEDDWLELKAETSLFKLSWKQTFPTARDGQATYYGKLVEGELE